MISAFNLAKTIFAVLIFTNLTSCEFQDTPKIKKKILLSQQLEDAILLINEIETYDSTFISLDRFDLNTVQLENKERFVFGDQYFGNEKDFTNNSTIVVFANGLVKINGKHQILKKVSNELIFTEYWINENYLIQSVGNSSEDERQLNIYDLTNKKRCSEKFYFRWYCEA
jgi:hypothetical protein